MNKHTILAVLIVMGIGSNLWAQECQDGRELLDWSREYMRAETANAQLQQGDAVQSIESFGKINMLSVGLYRGFMAGLLAWEMHDGRVHPQPSMQTLEDLYTAAAKWLERHPEELDKSGIQAAVDALDAVAP